jgi:hypothetical protein
VHGWCRSGRPSSVGRTQGGSQTANYYDVLGVASDASHDEVKRAFTARSLKYRPDQQHADDPFAIEQATWRRRELDEAWAVLRSPSDRAAYDLRLSPQTAEAATAVAPTWTSTGAWAGRDYSRRGADEPRAWFTEPEVAEIEPIDETDLATTHRRRTVSLGPLAVGAAILILVLLVLTRIGTDRADVTIQTRERYPPSSCVSIERSDDGHNTAAEVPCNGNHTGRVVDKVEPGSSCPPHTEYTALDALDLVLCLQR